MCYRPLSREARGCPRSRSCQGQAARRWTEPRCLSPPPPSGAAAEGPRGRVCCLSSWPIVCRVPRPEAAPLEGETGNIGADRLSCPSRERPGGTPVSSLSSPRPFRPQTLGSIHGVSASSPHTAAWATVQQTPGRTEPSCTPRGLCPRLLSAWAPILPDPACPSWPCTPAQHPSPHPSHACLLSGPHLRAARWGTPPPCFSMCSAWLVLSPGLLQGSRPIRVLKVGSSWNLPFRAVTHRVPVH